MKDTLAQLLEGSPVFQQLLGGSAFGTDAGFLSGLLFAILPVLVAFFALAQASAWARDLDAGRLEMVLATPVPRWRVYLEAWGATLAALVIAPLILWVVLLVSLQIAGLQVDTGRLLAAFVGFLPIELVSAAIVFLLAGRLSAVAANSGDSGVLGVSFLGRVPQPRHPPARLADWPLDLPPLRQPAARRPAVGTLARPDRHRRRLRRARPGAVHPGRRAAGQLAAFRGH